MAYENKALSGGQYKAAEERAIERNISMGLPWKEVLSQRVEILAEQTVSATNISFPFTGIRSYDIKEGETYRVYWNGTAYDCTAYKYSGFPMLGNNYLADNTKVDTGEPFAISMIGGDNCTGFKTTANVENITIAVEKPENVTWHQIDPKYIKDMYYSEEGGEIVILPETEAQFVEGAFNGMDAFVIFSAPVLEVGKTYRVKYNGAEYDSVALDGTFIGGTGAVILGDLYTFMGGGMGTAPTGEPFLFMSQPLNGTSGLMPIDEATTITFGITQQGEKVHHIDPKYIKDMYYTEGGGAELLPETVATNGDGVYIIEVPLSLTVGATYLVNYNGVTYPLIAIDAGVLDADYAGHGVILGNVGALTGNSYGDCPFILLVESLEGVLVFPIDDARSVTLSIYECGIVHHVPGVYIPNEIARIEYVKSQIAEVTESVDSLASDVDAVSSTMNTKASVNALKSHEENKNNPHGVTAAQIGAATTSEVNTLKSNLSTVQSDVGTLQSNLSTVQTTTNTLNSNMSTAQSDITALQTSVSKMPGRVVRGESFTIGEETVTADLGAEVFNVVGVVGSNIATGQFSHAEGYGTIASGNNSHAECYNTTASEHASHAEGFDTIASGRASHAEGYNTTASGNNSHAEGLDTIASGYASHAEGSGTIASGSDSHVQGKYNIVDTENDYVHIVGNGSADDERSNAHTLDWDGNAWFAGNVKIGGTGQDDTTAKTLATTSEVDTVKSDVSTLQTDVSTLKTSVSNIVKTPGRIVTGESFTIDEETVVAENGAEIFNNTATNKATGLFSHAEGHSTIASGSYSHAEGRGKASGEGSHAEGNGTASGDYSHAEGRATATELYSHAEGNGTATGFYSHAEGSGTASGTWSHAEGLDTIASGYASHAEGVGTTVSGFASHVQGKYNIVDDAQKYAHIIGNGTAEDARSNAHTLDWHGNAWFAGDVKIGGIGQDDAAAKTLATIEYVDSLFNSYVTEIDTLLGGDS